MKKKTIIIIGNLIINGVIVFLIAGIFAAALQVLFKGKGAPENVSLARVFAGGGVATLMYTSAGILIASVSTAIYRETVTRNIFDSLMTGGGIAFVFITSLVLIPVSHLKLKVVLAATAVTVGGLLYFGYLQKQRRQQTENREQNEQGNHKIHKKHEINTEKKQDDTLPNTSPLMEEDKGGGEI